MLFAHVVTIRMDLKIMHQTAHAEGACRTRTMRPTAHADGACIDENEVMSKAHSIQRPMPKVHASINKMMMLSRYTRNIYVVHIQIKQSLWL